MGLLRRSAWQTLERIPDAELALSYKRVRSFAEREMQSSRRLVQSLVTLVVCLITTVLGLTYGMVSVLPAVRILPIPFETREDGTHFFGPVMAMMPLSAQDAQIRATLWTYVQWRESYTESTARSRFDFVTALSDPKVAQAFADYYNGSNPDGPQVKYGRTNTIITVQQDAGADFLTSDPNVYAVPYWRTVVTPGVPPVTTHWTAYVRYHRVSSVPYGEATTINPAAVKVSAYPPPMEDGKPPSKGVGL